MERSKYKFFLSHKKNQLSVSSPICTNDDIATRRASILDYVTALLKVELGVEPRLLRGIRHATRKIRQERTASRVSILLPSAYWGTRRRRYARLAKRSYDEPRATSDTEVPEARENTSRVSENRFVWRYENVEKKGSTRFGPFAGNREITQRASTGCLRIASFSAGSSAGLRIKGNRSDATRQRRAENEPAREARRVE